MKLKRMLKVAMKWIKNRDESPLVCVEDAIVVDSSNMTFDETVEHILHLVQERI